MFGKLPTLLFIIPFGILLFAGQLWILHRRLRLTVLRACVAAVTALYAAGIAANTVFPIYLAWPQPAETEPLPLNLVPLLDYELLDFTQNVIAFVPIGIILSLVLRRPHWWRVVPIAAGVSLAIEVTQFITAQFAHGGHIADINDLLSNTLGAATGYVLYAADASTGPRAAGGAASLEERHRYPAAGAS